MALARLGIAQFLHNSFARNLKELRASLPSTTKRVLTDKKEFKQMYMHAFQLNKEPEVRVLPLEVAVPVWQLL